VGRIHGAVADAAGGAPCPAAGLHASVRSSVWGWDGYRAVTADSFCRYGSRKSVTLLTRADIAAHPPAARAVSQQELRPRLCHIKKGPNGYGFNLHSEKSRPGQFVRAVDPDSPAEAAGLRAQDRIVEVNGMSVEGKQHADVVAAIKAGGDETKLLVVGTLADEFFKKCRVVPSEAHLAGPLPEPIANGDIEKENGGELRLSSVSERPPSPALATSPEGNETHSEVGLGDNG
uniref:Na(+)/H(+) exchange regulatory cofactor NHE-RF1 n=1 Tax=Chrysolophus pictus TaxID=9089 RepID=A0A8C3M2I5_CHRPC